jgi:hypothetical protein
MSDSGLYMHLYSQLRDYAELIDRVIVGLDGSAAPPRDDDRTHLAQVLRDLQRSPSSSLSTALLANVLRENRAAAGVKWDEVADALDGRRNDTATLRRLEQLARALESERAELHARVHGSHAR